MKNEKKVLFTGGSGLLGGEFKKLAPDMDYPESSVFDITNYAQMDKYLEDKEIDMIIHAAAFTSPPKADEEPIKALEANIIGTANVVKLCMERGIKLVYISTDYVFDGEQGNYKESDPVNPVNNYAISKLGGECAVRLFDNSLVIRTTFGPNEFPYPKAFSDQWTSRESVSVIAGMIYKLLNKKIVGLIHVGGKRKSVLEFARALDETNEIGELSINDVNFNVPVDTSLDCGIYNAIISEK